MTENVENIMLEHLRAIRSDMATMSDNMRAMSAEMRSMQQHMAGVMTLQGHDHEDIIKLKERMERIEKRLELVD